MGLPRSAVLYAEITSRQAALSRQTAINPLDIPSVTQYNQLMLSTLRHWFKHLCYWFRTHTYNRYHILDLKRAEPENPDGYRWGWTDRCYSLMLANFLVLRDFVEQEKPWSCAEYIAELEANGDPNGELPSLRKQQADYEECLLLYRWWVKDRFDEYRDFEQREVEMFERFKKTGDESDREAWFAADLAKEKRNNEMLHLLIALRGYLWT